MKRFTIKELASAIGGTPVGDASLSFSGAAEPQTATNDQLAVATHPKYVARLAEGSAQAALLSEGVDWADLGLKAAILIKRPKLGMGHMSRLMDQRWRQGQTGIHSTAQIDPSAQVGSGATIGAFCVIGSDVVIGENAWIGPHTIIEHGTRIGAHATLLARVTIGKDVRIGDRFVAHSGAVIGADGFSFVTPEPSGVEKARQSLGDQGDVTAQSWMRVHSLGSVTIGDDVEVGANTCIDRGTIRDTVIGNGCKFDNLAQIGHNVVIGDDSLICAQVGIAGSSHIGRNVVLGGQTGISDNTRVGDNVITGGATKVLANVPAGRVMLGYPAIKMDQQLEIHRLLRRLPRIVKDLTASKKPIPNDD